MVDDTRGSLLFLTDLTTSADEPFHDVLSRLASELTDFRSGGTLEIRVVDGDQAHEQESYFIEVTAMGASVQRAAIDTPSLVATMPGALLRSILQGKYSPQQAYLDGSVTLEGNVELAREILRRFARPSTAASVCPTLTKVFYFPVGGVLRLLGVGFTPSNTVTLGYDYGDDTPNWEQIAHTDTSGSFQIDQENIPCGDREGDPAVGVIVTAIDNATRQITQQPFRTPC